MNRNLHNPKPTQVKTLIAEKMISNLSTKTRREKERKTTTSFPRSIILVHFRTQAMTLPEIMTGVTLMLQSVVQGLQGHHKSWNIKFLAAIIKIVRQR